MLKLFIHITRDETGKLELKTNVQDKCLVAGLLEVAKSAVLDNKQTSIVLARGHDGNASGS